jgi:hypothetical protein
MVTINLTLQQVEILINVIDNAPFNGTVGQATEVFNAIGQLLDIKNQLVVKPEQAEAEK